MTSRPPVLTRRCWRLVSDQVSIRAPVAAARDSRGYAKTLSWSRTSSVGTDDMTAASARRLPAFLDPRSAVPLAENRTTARLEPRDWDGGLTRGHSPPTWCSTLATTRQLRLAIRVFAQVQSPQNVAVDTRGEPHEQRWDITCRVYANGRSILDSTRRLDTIDRLFTIQDAIVQRIPNRRIVTTGWPGFHDRIDRTRRVPLFIG